MKIAETKIWYAIKPYVPSGIWDDILNLIFWLRSFSYKGKLHQCPICHFHIRQFVGNSCPRCDAGSRHRALWLYLNRRSDLFNKRTKLLHFAPEHCLHKRIRKHKNIEYLSGDLTSTRAMEKIDMMNISYPDNYFDVILSVDVLMHVDNDSTALKELHRVLHPEGWAIHLVSIDRNLKKTVYADKINADERAELFDHFDYKRNYGLNYDQILSSRGFDVQVINIKEFTSTHEREKYKIPGYFDIYLCKKKNDCETSINLLI